MATLTPRRKWAAIGASGAVLIVALGWFFLIRSQTSSRSSYENQAADAQAQAAVSRSKVHALTEENKKLPQYKADLDVLDAALPKLPSTAQFVNDMQHLGLSSGVTITAINITPPAATNPMSATQLVAGARPLPITVAASGSTAHLEAFLTQLQTSERRAVVVGQATEAVPADGSAGSGSKAALPTLSVSMTAYFTATS